MAAAERIVRPGGIIVMAAACEDGVPGDGAFARLLAEARTPADLVGAAGAPELDRWQAQVLGRVLGTGRGAPARRRPRRALVPGCAASTDVSDLDAAVAVSSGASRTRGAGGRAARGPAHGGDGARPRLSRALVSGVPGQRSRKPADVPNHTGRTTNAERRPGRPIVVRTGGRGKQARNRTMGSGARCLSPRPPQLQRQCHNPKSRSPGNLQIWLRRRAAHRTKRQCRCL